jgi:hypothetical protein
MTTKTTTTDDDDAHKDRTTTKSITNMTENTEKDAKKEKHGGDKVKRTHGRCTKGKAIRRL